jgi:hypothetical protein
MHSGAGEHDEPLDPDVVVVGAGGVAHGPLPPTPSGSAGVLAALAAGSYNVDATAMCQRAPQVSSYSSEGDADPDVSDGDSDSFFARNSEDAARGAFSRAHLLPHAHVHAGCRVGGDADEDEDDGDGGWGGFNGIGSARRAKGGLYGPSVGMNVEVEEECDYDEEDEDDDEGSDEPAIEVRRRRPSWAVHHDEHEGDDEDDEEEGPPPESPLLPPREGESTDGDEP